MRAFFPFLFYGKFCELYLITELSTLLGGVHGGIKLDYRAIHFLFHQYRSRTNLNLMVTSHHTPHSDRITLFPIGPAAAIQSVTIFQGLARAVVEFANLDVGLGVIYTHHVFYGVCAQRQQGAWSRRRI